MNRPRELLQKCRELGATFTPSNDRVKIKAPLPLPDDLVSELKKAKPQILKELFYERRDQANYWLLEEWRRLSIPEWRKKLRKSIELKSPSNEKYARWMLKDVLEDPEYKEEQ